MSSVIKTAPSPLVFKSKEAICMALDAMHIEYKISGNDIVTNIRDYFKKEKFVYNSGLQGYTYQHASVDKVGYSSGNDWLDIKKWVPFSEFFQQLEYEYKNAQTRLDEEKEKEKIERREQYIESQKKDIIGRSDVSGYSVSDLLQQISQEYDNEQKLLEEEKKREEEERRIQYVESQKNAIIEKAKAKGYSVKEIKDGDKIRLVLVRTKY